MAVLSNRHRAYAHIRRKMAAGELMMGSHLSEEALAREIGISRTPVREALNRLGTQGFVEHVPNVGTFVKKFTRQELWELLELRELLEGYAAARAAARMGPAQLDELQILCDRMRQVCHKLRTHKQADFPPEAIKRFNLADESFHMILLRASGNAQVERLVEDYGLITNLCRRTFPMPATMRFSTLFWSWAAHVRILRALQAHDDERARRWMSDHISRSKATIMRYFDEVEEPAVTRGDMSVAPGDEASTSRWEAAD